MFDLLFARLDKDAAHHVWQKQLADTSSKKKSDDDELD